MYNDTIYDEAMRLAILSLGPTWENGSIPARATKRAIEILPLIDRCGEGLSCVRAVDLADVVSGIVRGFEQDPSGKGEVVVYSDATGADKRAYLPPSGSIAGKIAKASAESVSGAPAHLYIGRGEDPVSDKEVNDDLQDCFLWAKLA